MVGYDLHCHSVLGGRGGGNMGGPGSHMGGPGPEPGSVLLIYGLATGKFNCDKLFNIMCIYGNVFRVSDSHTSNNQAHFDV